MNQLFKTRWFQIGGLIALTIAVVYAMIYVDVVLRARSAYREGEKYWQWHQNPELKKTYLKEEMDKKIAAIKKKYEKRKLSKPEYEQELQIAEFSFNESLHESSIKYAYIWYQTAVELFSPPESRWVRLSRQKMPLAKEMWKEELRRQNIPFEDYMIE